MCGYLARGNHPLLCLKNWEWLVLGRVERGDGL